MHRYRHTLIQIPLSLILLCSSSCINKTQLADTTSAAEVPVTIECHVAYRSDVAVELQREEVVNFFDSDDTKTITFSELEFHAQYWSGVKDWDSRGLRISVKTKGTSNTLIAQLYQFGETENPRNQFAGGHGFTGLNYVYHPRSQAELQYWCITR